MPDTTPDMTTRHLPILTDLERRALDLVARPDHPLSDAATDLGISTDELFEMLDSPSLQPYLLAITRITQQLQFIHASRYHSENLENLSRIAGDQTADPALRLRACVTIFRGVHPAPRGEFPLQPPITRPPRQIVADQPARLPPSRINDTPPPATPPASPAPPSPPPAPKPASVDPPRQPRANPAQPEPAPACAASPAATRAHSTSTTQSTAPNRAAGLTAGSAPADLIAAQGRPTSRSAPTPNARPP